MIAKVPAHDSLVTTDLVQALTQCRNARSSAGMSTGIEANAGVAGCPRPQLHC